MLSQKQQPSPGPLRIEKSRVGAAVELALRGELDLSTAPVLDSELEAALADSSCERIVIDMSGLEFIDSTGIAILVRALRRDAGVSRIRFVPAARLEVTRVLEVTGLEARLVASGRYL